MHFYSWKQGLKTGMYYLRSRPATEAIKFTLDVEALLKEVIFIIIFRIKFKLLVLNVRYRSNNNFVVYLSKYKNIIILLGR